MQSKEQKLIWNVILSLVGFSLQNVDDNLPHRRV